MRSLTGAESSALQGAHARTYRRLEVMAPGGLWMDLSTLFLHRTTDTDVDRSVITSTFQLRRSHTTGGSISPLVTDTLDLGRRIRYYTATVAASAAAPSPSVYRLVFDGTIDEIDPSSDPVRVVARDRIGAQIADKWIKIGADIPSDGWTLEQLMQHILTAYAPGWTLHVPVATGVTLDADVRLDKSPVLDALRTLAGRIGWTLRPQWVDAVGDYRLVLYQPPRNKSTVDWTFPASRYFPVRKLSLSVAEIRNSVTISYKSAVSGERETHSDTDPASVADYGERWMEFVEPDDSPVNSLFRAQQLKSAALSDLARPYAEVEIEVPYHFAVDIDDRYTFGALPTHWSSSQTLAVVGYTQDEGLERERTLLKLRGKPTGGVARWHVSGAAGVPFLTGALWGIPAGADAIDLFLTAEGVNEAFPVRADVYADQPNGEHVLLHTFTASGQIIGPSDYPELGGIELIDNEPPSYWAKLTAANGVEVWVPVQIRTKGPPSIELSLRNVRLQDEDTQVRILGEYGKLVRWIFPYVTNEIELGAAGDPKVTSAHLDAAGIIETNPDADPRTFEYVVSKPPSGKYVIAQVEPRAEDIDTAGPAWKFKIQGPETLSVPRIDQVLWGGGPLTFSLSFRVMTDDGADGVVSVWLPGRAANLSPSGQASVGGTPATVGPGTPFSGGVNLGAIEGGADKSYTVLAEFTTFDGRTTGQVPLQVPDLRSMLMNRLGQLQGGTVWNALVMAPSIRPYNIPTTLAQLQANAEAYAQLSDRSVVAETGAAYKWTGTQWVADSEVSEIGYAPVLRAGIISAVHINVSTLSEITDDVGIIIKGQLTNQLGTASINLDAVGEQAFIASQHFHLSANGNAYFGGLLQEGASDQVVTIADGVVTAAIGNFNVLNALQAQIDNLSSISAEFSGGIILNGVGLPSSAGITFVGGTFSAGISTIATTGGLNMTVAASNNLNLSGDNNVVVSAAGDLFLNGTNVYINGVLQ